MPMPVQEQFSNDQIEKIKKLWEEGKTQKQIGDVYGVPRRTIMKLCRHLGLHRSPKEASNIKSPLDKPEIIEKIKELRNTHSLENIVEVVGGSPSAINRICKKYNIELDEEAYAAAQAERMKASWTQEKREAISGSKYEELNDSLWLHEHYVNKEMSMGDISKLIGAPLMSVSYYLRKHGVPIRSKEEIYSKLRRLTAKRSTIKTKWGAFKLQSKSEEDFVKSLSDSTKTVEYEKYKFEHIGLHYVPDFKINDEFVEIKPKEYAQHPHIDRQAFVKQWLIAQTNNIKIKCWYKGKYFDPEPIEDIDRYFCLNWKLIFNSPEECYEFLVSYGFHPPKWNRDYLLAGLNNESLKKIKGEKRLESTKANERTTNFIKHFSDHFWYSTYKDYNSVNMAFELGNLTVLKRSLRKLWERKRNINIYGLLLMISRNFRDFKIPSLFKPWVAEYVYEKLIPDGGIIVDPCMGWGGRLLGSLDGNYKYIGYDLNKNSVESHKKMSKFIGSRIKDTPEFVCADASKIEWPKADLLFTSPPYDDTEQYFGLNEKIDSAATYKNIMKFSGLIALNIPQRHKDLCVEIATKHNKKLINEFKMITREPYGERKSTYEPILIFN